MASVSGHQPPNRLCDYFVSVAWRTDGQDADQLAPTVTDRFPLVDWSDYELSSYAVAHMCMPQGLEVHAEHDLMPAISLPGEPLAMHLCRCQLPIKKQRV